METDFFKSTKVLRREIKYNVLNDFNKIGDRKLRKIVLQRQQQSSYIKGVCSYYLHKGLNGNMSHKEIINLAGAIEIYSTSMVLIDNLIDKHFHRDGETTFLEEYGPEMMGLASVYTANLGLLKLSSYLSNFLNLTGIKDFNAVDTAVTSAISMDIEHPTESSEILENIIKVNGITLGFPLALVASTATNNKMTIFEIMKFGVDTGTAFGLYEEIRDFVGEHGRGKASEMKMGRTPYFIADLVSRDSLFNASDYVGKNISDKEHQNLFELLKRKKAFKRTQKLIKNHFDYAKDILQKNLNLKEFEILDLLRVTIEDALNKLI